MYECVEGREFSSIFFSVWTEGVFIWLLDNNQIYARFNQINDFLISMIKKSIFTTLLSSCFIYFKFIILIEIILQFCKETLF